MWYVISSLKPWHFFLVQGQGRAFSHFSRPSLTPRDGQHPRRLCLWCFSCSVAMNDLQKHEARPILVSGGFFNMGEKIQPRLMTGRSGRFFESLKIQQYTTHGIRWYKHITQINPTHFFWYNRTVLCFLCFPMFSSISLDRRMSRIWDTLLSRTVQSRTATRCTAWS